MDMPFLFHDLDHWNKVLESDAFQPIADDDMKLWVITSTNFDLDGAAERITERNDEVVYQDKPILEGQRPALLPLGLYEEVHNRADKFAIHYRKWLKDLGVSDVV